MNRACISAALTGEFAMWTNVNIDTSTKLYQVNVSRVVTPDYHYRITHDLPLPDQPYSLSIIDHPSPIFSRTKDYLDGKLLTNYGVSQFSMKSNDPLWSSGLANCLAQLQSLQRGRRNKLLAKIKGQSLPLLMLYKERHQTSKLVTKFLDDMLFCATHIRNPKAILRRYGYARPVSRKKLAYLRRFASRGLTTVGETWLQYRFAWGPLFKDISDSFEAAAMSEKKGISSKVTAGLPFEFVHARTSRKQDGVTGQTGTFSMTGGYHITCRYLITDATLAIAAQVQNLEFTLWDSIPYSFMVDRLVNIGKYLDLRYATAGVAFSSGHETTFYECNAQYDERNIFDGYQNLVSGSPRYYFVSDYSGPPKKSVSLNRSLLSAFPEPTLEYPYKDFFQGASRIADVASLVLQRFKLKT